MDRIRRNPGAGSTRRPRPFFIRLVISIDSSELVLSPIVFRVRAYAGQRQNVSPLLRFSIAARRVAKRFTPVLIAVAAAGNFAGCATIHIIDPGISTMSDVRSRIGKPTDIRFSPNGQEIWEYATGPQGDETHVITFGVNGVVQGTRQALAEETIDRMVVGKTTKIEVRDLLGIPGDEYILGGIEVWEWRFKPAGFAPEMLVIHFGKDGTVAEVIRVMESVGGRARGKR